MGLRVAAGDQLVGPSLSSRRLALGPQVRVHAELWVGEVEGRGGLVKGRRSERWRIHGVEHLGMTSVVPRVFERRKVNIRRVGVEVSDGMGRAGERLEVGAVVLPEGSEILCNSVPRFGDVAIVEVVEGAIVRDVEVGGIDDLAQRGSRVKLRSSSFCTQEGTLGTPAIAWSTMV